MGRKEGRVRVETAVGDRDEERTQCMGSDDIGMSELRRKEDCTGKDDEGMAQIRRNEVSALREMTAWNRE
jgi:hypothetical protein